MDEDRVGGLASNGGLHIPRAQLSEGLSGASRQLSRLLQLLRMISQGPPLYSRPCTPPGPVIGSAPPTSLRCVAVLEQQPTIASSRRHPPQPAAHNPIYTQSPSLPRTTPTLPPPSACRHNNLTQSHLPSNNSHHRPPSRGTPTLQRQSSSIALRLARNPCTV